MKKGDVFEQGTNNWKVKSLSKDSVSLKNKFQGEILLRAGIVDDNMEIHLDKFHGVPFSEDHLIMILNIIKKYKKEE
jgi:hypothetical protein